MIDDRDRARAARCRANGVACDFDVAEAGHCRDREDVGNEINIEIFRHDFSDAAGT